jgi:hypothetical protein
MSWSESSDGLGILCDDNLFERPDKYQSQLANKYQSQLESAYLCSYITPQLFASGAAGVAATALNLTCILPPVDLI